MASAGFPAVARPATCKPTMLFTGNTEDQPNWATSSYSAGSTTTSSTTKRPTTPDPSPTIRAAGPSSQSRVVKAKLEDGSGSEPHGASWPPSNTPAGVSTPSTGTTENTPQPGGEPAAVERTTSGRTQLEPINGGRIQDLSWITTSIIHNETNQRNHRHDNECSQQEEPTAAVKEAALP